MSEDSGPSLTIGNQRFTYLAPENTDHLPMSTPIVTRSAEEVLKLLARVTSDPLICGGRPCIRGTRMRVSDIVEMMAHGATPAQILEDFPYLAEDDIAAALAYAAQAADHRVIRAA